MTESGHAISRGKTDVTYFLTCTLLYFLPPFPRRQSFTRPSNMIIMRPISCNDCPFFRKKVETHY